MTSPQTLTHKSWCREHQTDYEGEHCFSGGFEFGPMKPAQGDFPAHRKGDLWAAQQLGADDEPSIRDTARVRRPTHRSSRRVRGAAGGRCGHRSTPRPARPAPLLRRVSP